jgi:hypothetical protein
MIMLFLPTGRCLGVLRGLLTPLAVMALASVLSGAGDPLDAIQKIPASEASHHVGESAWVCGHVASAAFFASTKGRPTFINLDRPYPDQTFTVVVWEAARSRFDVPPERLLDGKTICVRGTIETYRGKPQIVVDDPGQIEISEPEGGGSELTPTERVFVKSLLSSLGYEANYGSPEWDQETVESVIAFQEGAGLQVTGEPDAATLRALAGKVGELREEDREMIIRLVLLELVRRQE